MVRLFLLQRGGGVKTSTLFAHYRMPNEIFMSGEMKNENPLGGVVFGTASGQVKTMFIVGNGSRSELVGVHPLLAACVWLAMTDPTRRYDSTLFDGLRTQREQDRHFAKGVSKVRFSRHQLGQAIDLVPYIDGRPQWDSTNPVVQKKIDEAFAENIKLMDKHAKKLGIKLKRFDWDKPHHQLENSNYDARRYLHRACTN